MQRIPMVFLLALALMGSLVFPNITQAKVGVGDQPKIDMTTINGQRINNQILRGRVVVIDFWATWCGPCVKAMPHMKKLYDEYGPKGVAFIGVSLDNSDRTVKSFVEKHNYDWPQVCDPKGSSKKMASEWGVRGIPRIFILNPESKVLWIGHPGSMDKPFKEAVAKYKDVMAKTIGAKKNDVPVQLDQETLTNANTQRTIAEAAANAEDYDTMLEAIAKSPVDALSHNGFAWSCRPLMQQLQKLEPAQRKMLNDARRKNVDQAKAYGAFLKAARKAKPPKPDTPE